MSLDAGFDHPLDALITIASLRELDLELGEAVVASFKTTATRAAARE